MFDKINYNYNLKSKLILIIKFLNVDTIFRMEEFIKGFPRIWWNNFEVFNHISLKQMLCQNNFFSRDALVAISFSL